MEKKKRAYEVDFDSNLLFTGQGSKVHQMQNFQVQVQQEEDGDMLVLEGVW